MWADLHLKSTGRNGSSNFFQNPYLRKKSHMKPVLGDIHPLQHLLKKNVLWPRLSVDMVTSTGTCLSVTRLSVDMVTSTGTCLSVTRLSVDIVTSTGTCLSVTRLPVDMVTFTGTCLSVILAFCDLNKKCHSSGWCGYGLGSVLTQEGRVALKRTMPGLKRRCWLQHMVYRSSIATHMDTMLMTSWSDHKPVVSISPQSLHLWTQAYSHRPGAHIPIFYVFSQVPNTTQPPDTWVGEYELTWSVAI